MALKSGSSDEARITMRICFPHLLVLGVVLAIIPYAIGQDQPTSAQDVSYRLLKIDRSEEGDKVFCAISLPEGVAVEKLKNALCKVICTEKLYAYKKVFIEVLLRYDRYVIFIGANSSIIAYYDYDLKYGPEGKLLVLLSETEAPRNRTLLLQFNHKTCGCQTNSESKPEQ